MTFVDNSYDHIAAADIIIGRAGATSIAEFATIGRACIIVPAEQLTGGHQLMNARVYEQHSAVVIVREADISTKLDVQIRALLNEKELRESLSKKIQKLAPTNSAQILATELIAISGKVKS
jgi:UDP-N-acetylglucosamine--N-acetylmuramyl-(pentapeptide) pyrophosphoryl-undecaprenol N-acetylglucosamine transferase